MLGNSRCIRTHLGSTDCDLTRPYASTAQQRSHPLLPSPCPHPPYPCSYSTWRSWWRPACTTRQYACCWPGGMRLAAACPRSTAWRRRQGPPPRCRCSAGRQHSQASTRACALDCLMCLLRSSQPGCAPYVCVCLCPMPPLPETNEPRNALSPPSLPRVCRTCLYVRSPAALLTPLCITHPPVPRLSTPDPHLCYASPPHLDIHAITLLLLLLRFCC